MTNLVQPSRVTGRGRRIAQRATPILANGDDLAHFVPAAYHAASRQVR
jgi:hypothetical protein